MYRFMLLIMSLHGGKPFLSIQSFKSSESSPLLDTLLCLSSSFGEPPSSKVPELEAEQHKVLWGRGCGEEIRLRFLHRGSEETLESGMGRAGRETHLVWKHVVTPSIGIRDSGDSDCFQAERFSGGDSEEFVVFSFSDVFFLIKDKRGKG